MRLPELLDRLQAEGKRDNVYVEGVDNPMLADSRTVITRTGEGRWEVGSVERGAPRVLATFDTEDELCAYVLHAQTGPVRRAPERSFEERYAAAVAVRRRIAQRNEVMVARGLPPAKLPPLPTRDGGWTQDELPDDR